jgi:uncharacterized protein (DUF1499 family)
VKRRLVSPYVGLPLALIALAVALSAGPGSRLGWWDFRFGFQLLTWAAYGGAFAALVSLVGLAIGRYRDAGWRTAIAGLLVGLAVFGVPLGLRSAARSVPPIHDISTDTENPPAFQAVLALRQKASNPPEYAGQEAAAQQHKAYPKLAPVKLTISQEDAFRRALDAAGRMGWEIVAADKATGRIEAVDTTFWFGFKDDVVIRVSSDDAGSRVDIRSKSRIGRGDAGKNARRITSFLNRL